MNIEIRKFILLESLKIEDSISKVLRELLEIEENDNKSLGFKGSALSFKNKVDILLDIGHITKEKYGEFIMFMEIRNQFIHNIDSNSFKIVLDRVNKKKKLLGIDSNLESFVKKDKNGKNTEKIYEVAFTHLCLNLKEILDEIHKTIVADKIKYLDNKIKALEANIYKKINSAIAESIDVVAETYGEALNKITKSENDYVEKMRDTFTVVFQEKLKEHEIL